MKTYIGTKILSAGTMTLGAYNVLRGWDIPENEDPTRAGYLVVYPDGYRSWSPQEVFEASYREISADEMRVLTAGVVISPIAPETNFFDRLKAEREQIFDRLGKLDDFILSGPGFAGMAQEARTLLQRQALQMRAYVDTLDARIKLVQDGLDDAEIEERAERIFNAMPDKPADVRWHAGGNSDKQVEARRMARKEFDTAKATGATFDEARGETFAPDGDFVAAEFQTFGVTLDTALDQKYEWPENVTMPDGRVLFMEGNIDNAEKPYTVGKATADRVKGEPASWRCDFATFDEARYRFDRLAASATAPTTDEPDDAGIIETRTTGGGSVETPVPFNG